jgi:splicing factor 3A subunit 1
VPTCMLCRCLQRLEWTRVKESEVDEMKAEKERERLAMMLIDWHEFSVVRTIDLDPSEDLSRLGPPLTKQMVIQLNKGADAEPGALSPPIVSQAICLLRCSGYQVYPFHFLP